MADGVDLARLVRLSERNLVPLREAEPGGKSARRPDLLGEKSVELGDGLALLCTKAAPMMSTEQAGAWIAVMVTALSDLPGWVATEAVAIVLHRPLRFLNEAEGEVRDAAAALLARHGTAQRRLRSLIAERARIAAIVDGGDHHSEDVEITADQIRAMPAAFRQFGLSAGYITQAEVDAALHGDELLAA